MSGLHVAQQDPQHGIAAQSDDPGQVRNDLDGIAAPDLREHTPDAERGTTPSSEQ